MSWDWLAVLCMALDGGSIRAATTLLAYGHPIFAGHFLGANQAQHRACLGDIAQWISFHGLHLVEIEIPDQ